MAKPKITNILKALMFKKDVNTTQLARDTDLPQQTLQRIVSGASPRPHAKTLKPLAEFFEISIEQLKGESPLPSDISSIDLPTIAKPKPKEIAIIDWQNLAEYQLAPDKIEINDTVFASPTFSGNAVAVYLPDSSMEPYFPKGTLLIVDLEKKISDGSFALIKVSESKAIIFRKILIDGENYYLKALSPDLTTFPMRLLTNNDKILGVMLEARHCYENI